MNYMTSGSGEKLADRLGWDMSLNVKQVALQVNDVSFDAISVYFVFNRIIFQELSKS